MALTEGTPSILISGADASNSVDIRKLTTNKALVTYAKSTVTYGRVIDISSGSLDTGTQTDIWSGGDLAPVALWVISSTLAVIFGQDNSGNAAMRTLTISGTTITENAIATVESTVSANGAQIAMVSSSVGLVAYNNGTASRLCRFTIAGTTITPGTPEDHDGVATLHTPHGLCQLDSSRVFLFYEGASASEAMVQVVDISSGISKGTAAQLDTNATMGASTGSKQMCVKIDTDKVVCLYDDTSEIPAEISGVVVVTSGTSISSQGTRFAVNNVDLDIALAIDAVDSNTVMANYQTTGGASVLLTLDISTTTITSNADSVTAATEATDSDHGGIAVVDNDSVLFIVQETITNDVYISIIGGFTAAPNYALTHSSGGAANVIACSADGAYIFCALEDGSGNQVITKATRPPNATKSAAYAPGGGTACNVVQVPSNPDLMIFFGNFGTDLTVIKYTISTGTNTDISPASLGAKVVNGLRVNPSDENEMICTVNTDEDVLYTSTGGTSWSTLDATLGFSATALWVLWSGPYYPHRYFAGGDNGVDLDVIYSPNAGSSSANYENATIGALTSITNIEAVEG